MSWPDSTIITPVTAYHQRSYVETYSRSILSVVHGFILVPRRVCPLQDACSPGKTHTRWDALCAHRVTRRVPLRTTGERARLRGRLVRKTARHGRLLSASGVSSTRSAVPDGTRHLWMVVIRRDATSASWPWGDCRTPVCSTQPWVCAEQHLCTTSCLSRAPTETSPVIAATLCARQGERGPPAIPAYTKL